MAGPAFAKAIFDTGRHHAVDAVALGQRKGFTIAVWPGTSPPPTCARAATGSGARRASVAARVRNCGTAPDAFRDHSHICRAPPDALWDPSRFRRRPPDALETPRSLRRAPPDAFGDRLHICRAPSERGCLERRDRAPCASWVLPTSGCAESGSALLSARRLLPFGAVWRRERRWQRAWSRCLAVPASVTEVRVRCALP